MLILQFKFWKVQGEGKGGGGSRKSTILKEYNTYLFWKSTIYTYFCAPYPQLSVVYQVQATWMTKTVHPNAVKSPHNIENVRRGIGFRVFVTDCLKRNTSKSFYDSFDYWLHEEVFSDQVLWNLMKKGFQNENESYWNFWRQN